jgi:hypothetical protein
VRLDDERLQDFFECLKARLAVGLVSSQLNCLPERFITHRVLILSVAANLNEDLNVLALVAKQVDDILGFAIDGESTLDKVDSVIVRFLQQFGLWFPHGIDIIFGLLDSLCRERANRH